LQRLIKYLLFSMRFLQSIVGYLTLPAAACQGSAYPPNVPTDLTPGRYIEGGSELGLDLYRSVAELPIVSPHGHIDVRLLADSTARLDPPGRLFVTTDHYVMRMLYWQGVPLERAGLRTRDGGEAAVDDRAVWQVLADNVQLFTRTKAGQDGEILQFDVDVHTYRGDSSLRCFHVNLTKIGLDRLENLWIRVMALSGS